MAKSIFGDIYGFLSGELTDEEIRQQQVQGLFGSPVRVEGTMQSQEFDEQGNPINQQSTVQAPDYRQSTGLFQNLPQEQVPLMQAAKQMVGNADPLMQKQGYSALDDLMAASLPDTDGGSDFKFGSGRNVVSDTNGDIFMATEVRDPSTGSTRIEYSGIGKTAGDSPVGKVEIVAEYGETSSEMQKRKADAAMVQQQNKINIGNANDTMNAYITSQQQMGNYTDAIAAIDDGANTNRASQLFPTMRASTAALENIGNRMALNILSGVSMGALSEKELEMLQATALPRMAAPELRKWLIARREAEQKYSSLLLDASQSYARGESRTAYATRKKAEFKAAKNKGKKLTGKARLDELRAKHAAK